MVQRAPNLDYMTAEDRISDANKALNSLSERAADKRAKLTAEATVPAMDAIRLARRMAAKSGDAAVIQEADALIARFDVITQGTAAARPNAFDLHPAASKEPLRHDMGTDEAHTVVTAQRGFDEGIPASEVGVTRDTIDALKKVIELKSKNATTDEQKNEVTRMHKRVDSLTRQLSTATPILRDLSALEKDREALSRQLEKLPKEAHASTRQALQRRLADLETRITAVRNAPVDLAEKVPLNALESGGRLGVSGFTFVTVQILDAHGSLVATVQARNQGSGGPHAEDVVLAKLNELPDRTRLAGATMIITGDQEVCGKCDVTLNKFAADNHLKSILNNTTVAPKMDSGGNITGDLGKAKTLVGKIADPAAVDKLEQRIPADGHVTNPVQTEIMRGGNPGPGVDDGPGTGGTGGTGTSHGGGDFRPGVTYEGRGEVVAPIAEHGPSAFRSAAADGAAALLQWGSSMLTEMADAKQAELADASIRAQISSVESQWLAHPELGCLFTIVWEVWDHGDAGEIRHFVAAIPRYGVDKQSARNSNAATAGEVANFKSHVESDEMWIEPPEPLAIHKLPSPFRRIALATFANQDEVQDVSWRGSSTFDDLGFTSLKSREGAEARFYILQPPDGITYADGRDRRSTSVPIRHRAAPEGWTIPVVDLDTVVGLIPFKDHDTAAIVYPADAYTASIFKDAPAVRDGGSQLRNYEFQNVRFVAPGNIRVLKSLSESDIPTPDVLADMTPQNWAELAIVSRGHEVSELWERLSAQGGIKVSPEFVHQFLSLLPGDLTEEEVERLTTGFGSKTTKMSEAQLLDAWREAIGRLRESNGPAEMPKDAVQTQIIDLLAKVNWNGLPKGIYFRSAQSEGGPIGTKVQTGYEALWYENGPTRRIGGLCTIDILETENDMTPVTVTAVNSEAYSVDGTSLGELRTLVGKTYRLKVVKRGADPAALKSAGKTP